MKFFQIFETQDHITSAAIRSSACILIPVDSVLTVVRSGILQHTIPVAINKVPVCLNQDMKALLPEEGIVSKYLAYLIQGLQEHLLDDWVKQGATVESIEHSVMADTPIPVPPEERQLAIVDYLDIEIARIDALIDDKESLIQTLSEMRRSAVTEAITRGIKRSPEMQASGLSWVSELPQGWKTIPLKRFIRLHGGHTPATGNPEYWDGGIPWFSPKDMKSDELADSIDHVTDIAVKEGGLQLIDAGTTFIVVRGMILAHSFPVCVNMVQATINQDMKALIPNETVHPRFLPWLLRGATPLFLSLAEQSAHGTLALRTDRFMSEPLPIPPPGEQFGIVHYLTAERGRLDELANYVKAEVELLNELRSSTITDAVLGRIDVGRHTKGTMQRRRAAA
jgi:type I restriction enzyme S subunit